MKRIWSLLFIIIFIISLSYKYTSSEAITTREYTYIVKKGDTLWDIAKSYNNNNQDVREIIFNIKKQNKIDSLIYPGQEITIKI